MMLGFMQRLVRFHQCGHLGSIDPRLKPSRRLHMPGRLLTAACWSDPMTALKLCRSSSDTGSSGFILRSLGMEIGWMLLMYCVWLIHMDWSGCWSMRRPVKVKILFCWDPKGNFSESCWSFCWKSLPSSTWIPLMPLVAPVEGSGSTKVHGSKGLGTKSRASRPRLSSINDKYGASTRPYAPLSNCKISDGFKQSFSRSSAVRSMPRMRSPCSQAVLISKDSMSHPHWSGPLEDQHAWHCWTIMRDFMDKRVFISQYNKSCLWDMFGSIRLWLINTFPRQDPAAAKNVFFGNLVSQDLRYCFCC